MALLGIANNMIATLIVYNIDEDLTFRMYHHSE